MGTIQTSLQKESIDMSCLKINTTCASVSVLKVTESMRSHVDNHSHDGAYYLSLQDKYNNKFIENFSNSEEYSIIFGEDDTPIQAWRDETHSAISMEEPKWASDDRKKDVSVVERALRILGLCNLTDDTVIYVTTEDSLFVEEGLK